MSTGSMPARRAPGRPRGWQSPGRDSWTQGSSCSYNSHQRGDEIMSAVGVRELKNRLTYYLRRAGKGEEVIVTERGRPVAVLRSLQHLDRAAGLETRLARLGALGIVTLPT